MISQDAHFGLAVYKSISADLSIKYGRFRLWSVSASVSGLSVILPLNEDMPLGGSVFYIVNAGNRRLIVKDSDETALQIIEVDEVAVINRSQ